MSSLESFDIRYSIQEDVSFMEQWLSTSKEREPFSFETNQETLQALNNWIGFAKYKASLTGIIDHRPCAVGTLFLMPYKKVSHHASFYLIVDPQLRRQGIGTSMVRNLLHLGKTRFRLESLHAEIYEPNGLISLLKKLNFQMFARQESFMQIEGHSHARVLMEHFFHE